MGADRTEADAKDASDIPIGAAAGYKGGNFVFPRCQSCAVSATEQRATQMRLQSIKKADIAVGKIGTPAGPPDAKIAEIAFAVEDEHVDAMMQSIAGQKIIVELAALQLGRAE